MFVTSSDGIARFRKDTSFGSWVSAEAERQFKRHFQSPEFPQKVHDEHEMEYPLIPAPLQNATDPVTAPYQELSKAIASFHNLLVERGRVCGFGGDTAARLASETLAYAASKKGTERFGVYRRYSKWVEAIAFNKIRDRCRGNSFERGVQLPDDYRGSDNSPTRLARSREYENALLGALEKLRTADSMLDPKLYQEIRRKILSNITSLKEISSALGIKPQQLDKYFRPNSADGEARWTDRELKLEPLYYAVLKLRLGRGMEPQAICDRLRLKDAAQVSQYQFQALRRVEEYLPAKFRGTSAPGESTFKGVDCNRLFDSR